ncbi:hypothetical protein CDV36_016585, partial [Fusarium kuroshium]
SRRELITVSSDASSGFKNSLFIRRSTHFAIAPITEGCNTEILDADVNLNAQLQPPTTSARLLNLFGQPSSDVHSRDESSPETGRS